MLALLWVKTENTSGLYNVLAEWQIIINSNRICIDPEMHFKKAKPKEAKQVKEALGCWPMPIYSFEHL